MARRSWTAEEDEAIEVGLKNGFGPQELANCLKGRTQDSVEGRMRRLGLERTLAPYDITLPSPVERVLELPVRPFTVPIPKSAPFSYPKAWTTAVVYGDTHVPYQDKDAIAIVMAVIADAQPDIIVNLGDLVDAWQISHFSKDPSRLDTLQDNIDEAREHLHQVSQIAPSARKVLLEGNHETRLSRIICGLEGPQRELGRLRAFQQALQWPNLLQLDSIGWEWVPERLQSRTQVLPKIITKHGTVVRKWSGLSAKGEWEKYGRSGISGHTHRLGTFLHRDHNGNSQWIESGCTCLLDAPYGVDFDWQQGLIVLTWNEDAFLQNVEMIAIRDGRAIWRDREYGN